MNEDFNPQDWAILKMPTGTLAEFRVAAKAASSDLIEEDRVVVRGKSVTVLFRTMRRSGNIGGLTGFAGVAAVFAASSLGLGAFAFVLLCVSLCIAVLTIQFAGVWRELRYRMRVALAAAHGIGQRQDLAFMLDLLAQFNRTEAGRHPLQIALREKIKRELMSFCSRRYINGYAPFGRFTLILLMISSTATVWGFAYWHLAAWPPDKLALLIFSILWAVTYFVLDRALTAWLLDMVVCAVYSFGICMESRSN